MYSVIGGVRAHNLPCTSRVTQIVHNHTRTSSALVTDDTIFIFAFIRVIIYFMNRFIFNHTTVDADTPQW
jgi:hypothetical protein